MYQNLKSNSALRETLVAGQLSVERLSTMTSEEMASSERREENHKLQQINIFNAKGAAPKNATTNEFMCGKCKQRKVSYYQMQTRSADEPMTSTSISEGADFSFLFVRGLWESVEVLGWSVYGARVHILLLVYSYWGSLTLKISQMDGTYCSVVVLIHQLYIRYYYFAFSRLAI
jgi:DNA-directed RNA polymerase subunit M/transcription elongation factor TFIIS